MNNKLKSEAVDMLFEGILQLKTVEECYDFFEDLCTIHEIYSYIKLYISKKTRNNNIK